jgi:trehalose 6-phosphate phosphatase
MLTETLPASPAANNLFQRVADAPSRLLMVDYDGTLAPFCVARDQAVPYPTVRAALDELLAADHTRVVLVSGRAAQEIPRLAGLQHPVEVWGSHGAERLHPHGGYTLATLPRAAHDAFVRAEDWAVAHALADRFERKPAAVAMHWRDLSLRATESLRSAVLSSWQPLARIAGLELRPFDGGLELRIPGFDKGAVVRALLAEAGDDVAAAFLGDDLTDEDAFSAIDGRGLGVLVRPEPRSTRASLWLRPPGELRAFLQCWHRAAGFAQGC